MAAFTEHNPWSKMDNYGGNMLHVQENSYQNCAMWRQPYSNFPGYGNQYPGQEHFSQGYPMTVPTEDSRRHQQTQGTTSSNTWASYQTAPSTSPPSVTINVNTRPASTGLENEWNFITCHPETTPQTSQTTSYGYRPQPNMGQLPNMDFHTQQAASSHPGAGSPSMPPLCRSPDEDAGSPGSQTGVVGPGARQNQRPPYDWMKKVAYPSAPSNGKTRTKDKYRVVYTDHQRLELEKEFHYSRYITIRRKAELAQNLSLSERQVKIWFQNRRAKERKQNKKRDEALANVKQEMSVSTMPLQTSPQPTLDHHNTLPNPQTANCAPIVTSLQS